MLSVFLFSLVSFTITATCLPTEEVIRSYRALDLEPSLELRLTDYGLAEWRRVKDAADGMSATGPPIFSTLVIDGKLHCFLAPLIREEKDK